VFGSAFNILSLPIELTATSILNNEHGGLWDLWAKHVCFEQFCLDNESDDAMSFAPKAKLSIQFQLVWYEIVIGSEYEPRRKCGNLYRDSDERKLQKQSFLVSH
jgi:hypothetical protein